MKILFKYKLYVFIAIVITVISCSKNKDIYGVDNEDSFFMKSDKLIDEVIIKSWNILIHGQQLADNGKTIDEIIKTFPKETVFQTNDNSILFFIEGSVPLIIEVNKIGSTGKGNSNVTSVSNLTTNTLSATSFNFEILTDVLASNKNDNRRQKKTALIIAPYNSTDFKNIDDADVAYKYLRENRNYADDLTFLKDNNILLDDFTSFGDYDMVHLSTHGEQICSNKKSKGKYVDGKFVTETIEEAKCTFTLSTNIKHGFKDLDNNKEQLKKFHSHYNKYNGSITYSIDKIVLTNYFFREMYQTKLKNKIWIFSACYLGKSNNMIANMNSLHKNGHFFHWEDWTDLDDSKKAFDKLYENMIVKGLDAYTAYQEIPTNLKNNLKSNLKSTEHKNALSIIQTEDDRHAIEIIELLNPETDESVRRDDFYPLKGSFNDGKKEILELNVKLLGYTKEEFESYKMSLSLFVNDKKVLSKKIFSPNNDSDKIKIQQVKEHKFGIIVTIKDIKIPDVGKKKKITLKAVLHLNNKNISIHKERVSIIPNDIKATITTLNGDKLIAYYDANSKIAKYEISDQKSAEIVYYMDNSCVGYFNEKGTWYKYDVPEKVFNALGMSLDWKKMIDEFNETYGFNPSCFQLLNFAMMIKMKTVNKLPTSLLFKKKKIVDKDGQITHYKFTLRGSDQLMLVFDHIGRLTEFKTPLTPNNIVKFEYGNYNLILPITNKTLVSQSDVNMLTNFYKKLMIQ